MSNKTTCFSSDNVAIFCNLGVGDKTYVFYARLASYIIIIAFSPVAVVEKKNVSENTVSYFSGLFGGPKILQDNSATVNEVDNLLDMR